MSKGHHREYPCPECQYPMIMEACGCMTCEACGHVVRPPGVYEGEPDAKGHIPLYRLHEYRAYGHMPIYSAPGKQPGPVLPTLRVVVFEERAADA